MANLVQDILEIVDDILGIRDELGALKHPIYILTRNWEGQKGLGTPTDTIEQVLPTPNLVNFSLEQDPNEVGKVAQGQILLKMISKNKYTEKQINGSVDNPESQDRWYYINGQLYEVVSVTEEYVYFNVLLKKTVKNKVYLG
jgi:hypothetical protein